MRQRKADVKCAILSETEKAVQLRALDGFGYEFWMPKVLCLSRAYAANAGDRGQEIDPGTGSGIRQAGFRELVDSDFGVYKCSAGAWECCWVDDLDYFEKNGCLSRDSG